MFGRRNKRQSESLILKVMMSEVIINFNMLGHFMKDRVISNLNDTLVVIIYHTIEKML